MAIEKRVTYGRRTVIAGVTLMWLLVLSVLVGICKTVFRWPWDLTLLIVGPIAAVFVPTAYSVALRGGAASRRDGELAPGREFVAGFFAAGILVGVVVLATVVAYVFVTSNRYVGGVALSAVALVSVVAAWHIILRP